MLLSGPSLLQHKNGQLGPDNNFANFCAQFCFQKKSVETPIFIVFLCKRCFLKTNLAQIVTLENPKLGPDNNFTAYIYIFIHIYLLFSGLLTSFEIAIWAKFSLLGVIIWAK